MSGFTDLASGTQKVATHVWDATANTGAGGWVKMTQPGGAGGGGIQYVNGTTTATPTGTVALGKTATNILNALSLDAGGNLNVNLAAGTISGGNAAASSTGTAVPIAASYTGFSVAGVLTGVSAANPLPITGTFWQAVQPVSGTVSVGSTVGLTDTQLRAAPIPVSGTVGVSGTIPISYTQQAIPAGSAVIGHVIVDTAPTTAIEQRRVIPQFVAISAALLGDNTLVALTAGQKIKVLQYTLISAGSVVGTIKSGATTPLTGALPFVANSGIASPFVAPAMGHLFETTTGQALVLNLSAAIAVTGHLTYIIEV